METSIKQYKPIFTIKTYDNEPIDLEATNIDKILDLINDKSVSFIKVSEDHLIAKSQIKSVDRLTPGNDIEEFIYRSSTGELRELFKQIYNERKSKNLITRSINHLLEIAQKRKPHLFTS